MAFAHDIAGGQGNLIATQLQSPNFSLSGQTGWAIMKNGDAYFFNITADGDITASEFIGTDFEINANGAYWYNGTPALGNPPVISIATPGTTQDPFGNTILPDLVIGQSTSPQVQLKTGGPSGAAELAFPLPGTWTNYPNLYGTVVGSGAVLSIDGPTDTTVDDQAWIGLYSAAASGNSSSAGYIVYNDANGGKNTIGLWDDAGLTLYVVQSMTAVEPGTGTSPTNPAKPETWHTITLDSGWTGAALSRAAPRYRLLPDGNIQLDGCASATAGSGAKTLNNSNPLPAAYRPLYPHDYYSSDAVGTRMHISIATSGVITANFPSGATGTWYAEINGILPLN